MPRYQISHRTSYEYGSPVVQSNHLLHLAPREFDHQRVMRHNLIIEPAPAWRSERVDYFGNPITLISVEDEHSELSVNALSEIEVKAAQQPNFSRSGAWESVAQQMPSNVAQFACASQLAAPTPALHEFARPSYPNGAPNLEGARALMERIFREFRFDNTTTDVSTPVEQVLAQKSGVCQDFAHLMIGSIRSLGLPARYMSGYILTHPPEGQIKLEGSDASHAWVSVWDPAAGWVDFDPTNNLVNSPEHIAIAYGRDFADVSPISGILLGGGKHSVSVAVDVIPVADKQTR
ncbi:MAG: transglutaminase family protein [Alphaproteobacteria bacterium]|nr:transglutaminase family protein [Alphaproteobacteria bacterium]